MRSLRFQLLLGTSLGATLVLLVTGALLYTMIDRTLRAKFDKALAAKARLLSTLVEQEANTLESELADATLPEFESWDRAEYYQIWSPDGKTFARSPSLGTHDLPTTDGPSNKPRFKTVVLPDGRPGRLVGIAFKPRLEQAWMRTRPIMTVRLAVARETIGLDATLARIRGLMIVVVLVAVATTAALLSSLIRRNLRPIVRLGEQIGQVGERGLSRRIDANGIQRELAPVVDRLNDLLSRLEAAFNRERQFTGDVAHELRTPLAGLRAKLELALSRPRGPEMYQSTMRDCLGVNLQMQRLVETLLHLVRADAGQLEVQQTPVDLAKLLRECWTSVEDQARDRGLTIDWDLADPPPLLTDSEMLRLVLCNILDNAATYAEANSEIVVALSATNGSLGLLVSNKSGLSKDEISHVFERFWRADGSDQRQDRTRCGLGLSLCEALIARLGGTISAEGGEGTFRLSVSIPQANHPTQE